MLSLERYTLMFHLPHEVVKKIRAVTDSKAWLKEYKKVTHPTEEQMSIAQYFLQASSFQSRTMMNAFTFGFPCLSELGIEFGR